MPDFLRFWWVLLSLNTRKTVFRLRGARGPAPCQVESDSGRARETRCDACAQWSQPGRLRRICPALKRMDGEWRCAVDAPDVRPHWGRAAGYLGGAGAGLYLLVALGVLGGLRRVGYEVSFQQIAWPLAWNEFAGVRSRYHLNQARAALAEHRVNEASLALALAHHYDPTNYTTGLALAQIWQAGQAARSDGLYARLLTGFPERAPETAHAWGQALLRRGDFAQLATLAAARLAEERDASAWLHALVFSARRQGDTALIDGVLASSSSSAEARLCLEREVAARAGGAEAGVRLLAAALDEGAGAYARCHQIEWLLEWGEARRALELAASYGPKLPADERVGLILGALVKLGEKAELHRQVEALLAANSRPAVFEVLATHLIRHPDEELRRRVADRLQAAAWVETPESASAHAALLCAAGVAADNPGLMTARAGLRRATGAPLRVLDGAEDVFAGGVGPKAWGNLLPALPMLPVATVYAVFEAEAGLRERRQP